MSLPPNSPPQVFWWKNLKSNEEALSEIPATSVSWYQTQAPVLGTPAGGVFQRRLADLRAADGPDGSRTVVVERGKLRRRLHGLDLQVAVLEIGRHLVHARHRQEGQRLGIGNIGAFEEVAVHIPVGEVRNARQLVGPALGQRGDDAVIVIVDHRHLRLAEEQFDERRTLEGQQVEGDRELPGIRIGEGNGVGGIGDDAAGPGIVAEGHHRASGVEFGRRDVALRLLRELVRHGVFVVVARRLHAVLRVIEEERQVGGLGARYGERPASQPPCRFRRFWCGSPPRRPSRRRRIPAP